MAKHCEDRRLPLADPALIGFQCVTGRPPTDLGKDHLCRCAAVPRAAPTRTRMTEDDLCHHSQIIPDHRQLILEAQRGDSRALDHLYQSTAPRLLGYVRALVGPDDADDVASETWASILAGLPAYRSERGDFHAWAATIARHRAIDHLRRGGRAPLPLPPERLPQHVSGLDTERDAVDSLATERALALIGRLPREQASAVLLRVVFGMDAISAGRLLRKHPGAVRTATHRGLQSLRELLSGGVAEHILEHVAEH